MLKRSACVFFVAICVGLFAPNTNAADADIYSVITAGPTSADYDELVQFQVDYGNYGPDDARYSFMNFDFPIGAYIDDASWDVAWDTTDDNVVKLFVDGSCDHLLIQLQGGDDPGSAVPLIMPNGATGTLTLDFTMPMANPAHLVARTDSPANLAGPLTFTTTTGCDDCSDIPDSCFGTPVSLVTPPAAAEFMLVDDGDDSGCPSGGTPRLTDLCQPISQGTLTGKIALIRRGCCDFGLKAYYAEDAGAEAVVIMNDRVQDVSTFSMSPGDFGLRVTIPVILVDMAEADALEASFLAGDNPTGTIGGEATDVAEFTSNIFHSTPAIGSADTDPVPTNNADTFTTALGVLFADDFESGQPSGWTVVTALID